MLTDGLEWYGLLVDYCGVFISCLDSHSDGTHSLQRIHWWASDVMLHFSKSDEETNFSTSSMAWGWVYFHQILNVWVNYSFKFKIICFNMDVVLPLLLCRFLGRFSNGCWNTDTGFCSCSDTNITEVRYVFVMESGLLFQCSWPVHKSFHFFVDHILCTGAFPADLIFLCIWTTLGCILD